MKHDTVYILHLPSGPRKFYAKAAAMSAARLVRKRRLPGKLLKIDRSSDGEENVEILEDWEVS